MKSRTFLMEVREDGTRAVTELTNVRRTLTFDQSFDADPVKRIKLVAEMGETVVERPVEARTAPGLAG